MKQWITPSMTSLEIEYTMNGTNPTSSEGGALRNLRGSGNGTKIPEATILACIGQPFSVVKQNLLAANINGVNEQKINALEFQWDGLNSSYS